VYTKCRKYNQDKSSTSNEHRFFIRILVKSGATIALGCRFIVVFKDKKRRYNEIRNKK